MKKTRYFKDQEETQVDMINGGVLRTWYTRLGTRRYEHPLAWDGFFERSEVYIEINQKEFKELIPKIKKQWSKEIIAQELISGSQFTGY